MKKLLLDNFDCNSVIKIPFKHENLFYSKQTDRIPIKSIPLKDCHLIPKSTDVSIIGAGLSGVYIALQLKNRFPSLTISLFDENDFYLQSFIEKTSKINQQTLRSNYKDQMAPDGDIQLIDYARLFWDKLNENERNQIELGLANQRSLVPLDIFLGHTTHSMQNYGLGEIGFKTKITNLTKRKNLWELKHQYGKSTTSKFVVIATGMKEKPISPDLPNIIKGYALNDHIDKLTSNDKIAVLGNGLTSGYIINTLLNKGISPIWLTRSYPRFKCSDVETKYFRQEGFYQFSDSNLADRIDILKKENRGSLMPEFQKMVTSSLASGKLKIITAKDFDFSYADNGITVKTSIGEKFTVDKLIDCTGLNLNIDLVSKFKCFDSYPVLDDQLQIMDSQNLYVIGKLASIIVGPAAKNIDGFRLASEKILPSIAKKIESDLKYHSYGLLITGTKRIGV